MKYIAKHALALCLVLLLLGAALAENDIYRRVAGAGYEPVASDTEAKQAACVFEVKSAGGILTWNLDGQQYSVVEKEDLGKLQALYLELLPEGAWDSAQYVGADGVALVGYHSEGQRAVEDAKTLAEYTQKVSALINGSEQRDYVLNKNTKRFHYPTCTDGATIKDSNREEVCEFRQKLIDDGYRPCGHCKP